MKLFTDSRFLVDSITQWLPRWKANGWRTSSNKPVQNQAEFQLLEEALKPMDVIFEHVPSHQGILGNEIADQLATQAIEARTSGELINRIPHQSTWTPPELIRLTQTVPDDPSSEGDIHQPEKENIRTELEKSLNKFNKSMVRRGMDPLDLTNKSLAWDHEGMNEDASRRNCISEGESDEEFLQKLEDEDPCGEYDDLAFSSRVSNYLKSLQIPAIESEPIQLTTLKESSEPENIPELPEFSKRIRPTIERKHVSFQTPTVTTYPYAHSTPYINSVPEEGNQQPEEGNQQPGTPTCRIENSSNYYPKIQTLRPEITPRRLIMTNNKKTYRLQNLKRNHILQQDSHQ